MHTRLSENPYSVDTETGVITSTNTSDRADFLLIDSPYAYGDYEMSATIKGDLTLPTSKEVHIGFIPWFKDSGNFMMTFMQWTHWDRPSEMRAVINWGYNDWNYQHTVWGTSSFVTREWSEIWTNGRTTAPAEGINFKIQKLRAPAGDADWIHVYINDVEVGFYGFKDTADHAHEQHYVGLYSMNDNVTFSNFKITPILSESTKAFANRLAEIGCEDMDTAEKALSIKNELTTAYNALAGVDKLALKGQFIEGQSAEERLNYFLSICDLRIAGTTEAQSALNTLLASKQTSLPIICVFGVAGLALVAFYYSKKRKEAKQ